MTCECQRRVNKSKGGKKKKKNPLKHNQLLGRAELRKKKKKSYLIGTASSIQSEKLCSSLRNNRWWERHVQIIKHLLSNQ